MNDCQFLEASEAYEAEKDRWSVRRNKLKDQEYEVVRNDDDGEPVLQASCWKEDVARYERDERAAIAAMKAAAVVLGAEPT